ncbi:hypothetical protein KR009_006695 [Drosophila setifemur]|nr:hypothetical protein KR009_006695 [Drosophila setifemur]
MDKVYIRNALESNDLNISFRYVNENFKLDREFNFCRQMNEPVDNILKRIHTNVHKELAKKWKKLKRTEEMPSELEIKIYRDGSDSSLNNLTFAELLSKDICGLKLQLLDTAFDVVVNQPWIKGIQLPKCILAGCLVYPTKFESQFADREYCQGIWFKSKFPEKQQWEECGAGFRYETSDEDVDYYLKFSVTPKNGKGEAGPAVEAISKCPVQAGPGPCPYETRHQHTPSYLTKPNEVRVVTYNLLADLYADSDYSRSTLFPYCPPECLQIEYRKQLFLKELLGYHADVICLQEVDQRIFDTDLKEVLEQPPHNFRGFLATKGEAPEGVAIFYRTSRFELLKSHILNIGNNLSTLPIFTDLWNKIKDNTQLAKRICERSTTVEIALLKMRATENYLLVANTHLYFHPDADHIRLLQMCFAIIYTEHIRNMAKREFNIKAENIGLIFCGDFNSVPECGIYKLMTEQFVDESLEDWRSNLEEAVTGVHVSQPFKMASACGTPKFTNFTTLFSGCLDYIFYQQDRFELLQSVPLPTDDQLRENTAIPSALIPSDHVALIADLKFKTD